MKRKKENTTKSTQNASRKPFSYFFGALSKESGEKLEKIIITGRAKRRLKTLKAL